MSSDQYNGISYSGWSQKFCTFFPFSKYRFFRVGEKKELRVTQSSSFHQTRWVLRTKILSFNTKSVGWLKPPILMISSTQTHTFFYPFAKYDSCNARLEHFFEF